MYQIKRVLIIFLFFISACTPSAKYLEKMKYQKKSIGRDVRVLLLSTSSSFKVGSAGRLKISDLKTRKVLSDVKNTIIRIYPSKVTKTLIIESWNKPLIFNGKKYRGKIELHNVFGKIYVVNVLPLEDYLLGVVPNEIPASWHIESLKAQAVAARTYTVYHLLKVKRKNKIYDLDSTTNFQVYNGLSSEKESSSRAVRSTKFLIMTYRHEAILAYFHSTCGGKTADDKNVWKGSDLEYLSSVSCNYCKNSKHYMWKSSITLDELNRYIKPKYKGMGKIKTISFQKKEGRVVSVKIIHSRGSNIISGNKFRLIFPSKKLKSLYIDTKGTASGIMINGRGWGHGVGMCQWGAKGMAEKGYTFKKILKHYYKNISIKKMK